jgi:hypothetical protein
MTLRRLSLLAPAVLLALAFPSRLAAQSFDLRNLLTDFLREGITLAPPTAPFPSHAAHFIGADSPQFLAMQQFSAELASELSSFPVASAAGGFTYRFDPELGIFTRATDSFGPVYADRADTIGKGKFNVGLNFSHFTFDSVNDLDLRDGDLRLVFTHEDTNHDGHNETLFFEGDVITAQLFLKIETDVTAFVLSYGVSDRFDVGLVVPLVSVDMQAETQAQIQRIATNPTAPAIHTFRNGTAEDAFTQSGSASGLGDMVVRAKWQIVRGTEGGGLALLGDVRLPTGDERDLLGTGATRGIVFLVGSLQLGKFSPHGNVGYGISSDGPEGLEIPEELDYKVGFDWALNPRLTIAADVLGRVLYDATVVSVENETFEANISPTPPPQIVTAEFPRLVTSTEDSHRMVGSFGLKLNPFGTFVVTLNGLFPLNDEGLRDDFSPLVAVDWSF